MNLAYALVPHGMRHTAIVRLSATMRAKAHTERSDSPVVMSASAERSREALRPYGDACQLGDLDMNKRNGRNGNVATVERESLNGELATVEAQRTTELPTVEALLGYGKKGTATVTGYAPDKSGALRKIGAKVPLSGCTDATEAGLRKAIRALPAIPFSAEVGGQYIDPETGKPKAAAKGSNVVPGSSLLPHLATERFPVVAE